MSASVLLATLALLAAAPPAPHKRPVVSEVTLRLPPGEDPSLVESLVAVKPGQPLATPALRRTVQALYELGRYSNVVARTLTRRGPAGEAHLVVVVECLPKRVIRTVTFRSEKAALSLDALRAAASLPTGEELYPERLQVAIEGVRRALQRRGYRQAMVKAVDDGAAAASLEIRISEGEPTRVASLSLGPQPGLSTAQLQRTLRTQLGAVLDLDLLEEDARDVRAALRQGGFYRSEVKSPVVEVEERERMADVRIPVSSGPRILFRFVGNVSFSAQELRSHLGFDVEQTLDGPAIEIAASQLTDYLRARGFLEARVTAQEHALGRQVVVLFRVDEGRRYRLGSVRFSGAKAHEESWLRERLMEGLEEEAAEERRNGRAEMDELAEAGGTGVRRPARSLQGLDPTATHYEPTWGRAMTRILDSYREDGYLEASQEGTRVTLDSTRGVVDVEVRLKEGVQTRVESVEVEGNVALESSELRREVKLESGGPLSFARIEQTRIALLERYALAGYAYARIEDDEQFSPDRKRAAVRFRVYEGPQVHIANVVVAGAKRTREDVVRGTLTIRPGDLYEPNGVARSQAELLRLGVFRSASLRVNDPDRPEATKDLTVEVTERPWQTLSAGAGFSIADGPRAFLEYSQPNLWGRALEFTVRGKVNYLLDTPLAPRPDLNGKPTLEHVEGRADVGLHYPRMHFLPFNAAGRFDVIAERLHRRSYELSRASTIVGFDWLTTDRVAFSLQYEFEVDHIQKRSSSRTLTRADIETLRFPEGVTTLHSLRPTISLDYRDNSNHPRRGWFASTMVELMHSLGSPGSRYLFGVIPGSDVFTSILKATLTLSSYLPMGANNVLALSLRAGQIYPLNFASQTIAPKRFFLGGASTMRGYGEDEMIPEDARAIYASQRERCAGSLSGLACTGTGSQLTSGQTLVSEGGQSFLLMKVELRIPLSSALEFGLFTDVGNLWFDHTAIDPTGRQIRSLHVNTGVGLRFITPVGPAALDVGFNLSPDPRLNESVVAPHFAIGLF